MFTDNGNGFNVSMPVTPMSGYGGYPMMYGGNGGLFGGGWGGNDIIGILFIIALCGGGWGGFGGGWGNEMMFPWLMSGNQMLGNQVQSGFDQAATAAALNGIQTGMTTGFSNAEVAACNRAMNDMQTAYQNQIASMQQNFAAQQALDSRLDSIAAAQAQCCCDQKAAVTDLKYTIASEAAATRSANQAGFQMLMDKACQLEKDGILNQLEAARRNEVALQNKINLAELRASQLEQTKQIEDYIRPPINPMFAVPNPYATYGNNCGGCSNTCAGFSA